MKNALLETPHNAERYIGKYSKLKGHSHEKYFEIITLK
jgi:hypothetical protein